MEWPAKQITDHAVRALARLTSQYEDADNLRLWVDQDADRVQTLEDVFWDLLTARWIPTAAGAQLDELGALVGEDRNARTDTVYRAAIITRVTLNQGAGEAETIITGILALTGAQRVQLTEVFPAGLELLVISEVPPVDISGTVEALLPAGVKVISYSTTGGTPFGFGVNDGVGVDDPDALGYAELGEGTNGQDDANAGILVELA